MVYRCVAHFLLHSSVCTSVSKDEPARSSRSHFGKRHPNLTVSFVELWDILYCDEEIWGIVRMSWATSSSRTYYFPYNMPVYKYIISYHMANHLNITSWFLAASVFAQDLFVIFSSLKTCWLLSAGPAMLALWERWHLRSASWRSHPLVISSDFYSGIYSDWMGFMVI